MLQALYYFPLKLIHEGVIKIHFTASLWTGAVTATEGNSPHPQTWLGVVDGCKYAGSSCLPHHLFPC